MPIASKPLGKTSKRVNTNAGTWLSRWPNGWKRFFRSFATTFVQICTSRGTRLALPLFLLLAVSGCASLPSPATALRPGVDERGQASWYGNQYHGRQTASGETFDQEAMTAAHKELPFGTVVEVRNRNNDQTVVVRINDRGPFVRGRIIDLSRGAAREIDMIGAGVVPVDLRILEKGEEQPRQRRRFLDFVLPWRWI